MELKNFKILLENIKNDLEKAERDSPYHLPLMFTTDVLLEHLTNGYLESPNTFIIEAKDGKAVYRLTLKFDENISNILAKSDVINAIQNLRLEVKTT